MSIHRMPIDGEVVSSRRIPIPGAPARPLPEAPKTDIQRGFLGFGNPVDVESARRKRLLQRVAEELQYGERLGLSLEVSGIKDIRAATEEVEDVVALTEPDTLTGKMTEVVAADAAARARQRHQNIMSVYDGLTLSIIQHRR